MARIVATWAAVFAVFAAVFVASYEILPRYDHRYRAVLYPGDALGEELARRFRAATGRPLTYVIGTMWDGGNVAHYARRAAARADRRQSAARALDRSRRSALQGRGRGVDRRRSATSCRWPTASLAGDAQVQPPFTLPFRRGDGELTVGWAILRPQPAFAAR